MELLLTWRETDKTYKKVCLKNMKYMLSVKSDLKLYKNDLFAKKCQTALEQTSPALSKLQIQDIKFCTLF